MCLTSIYIDRKVTLDLRFVTVTEVLEKICEQVGYHYYIEPGWVEIRTRESSIRLDVLDHGEKNP